MKRSTQEGTSKNKSIYDLTTRQLRAEIRERTKSVNQAITKYRLEVSSGITKENRMLEKMLNKVKQASAYINKAGKAVIPTGKTGEIGLGLSYKTKSALQNQLLQLRSFEENDVYTTDGKDRFNEKVAKQYETFKERYGYVTEEEYENMIDTMNIVKNTLKDYGYEDYGKTLARIYSKANKSGKIKFISYVDKIKKEIAENGAVSTEDILDRVADMLRKNKELI